jgi:hypothetical protein
VYRFPPKPEDNLMGWIQSHGWEVSSSTGSLGSSSVRRYDRSSSSNNSIDFDCVTSISKGRDVGRGVSQVVTAEHE